MKKSALSLAIWMLLFSTAMAGTMHIVGPNERGEGPLPPATGTGSEMGLFFVDIYAEDMPNFAGFQAKLEFLDETLVDAAGSTIYIAYNHLTPEPGAPWSDRQITWNQDFLPDIYEAFRDNTFGVISTERVWLPIPVNDWGDFVDKTITDKTWLMTVGYWYLPGAEGDGAQTYTIGAAPQTTMFGNKDSEEIPHTAVSGSITIGGPNGPYAYCEVGSDHRVSITGDRPGTTTYTVPCNDREVVDLTAPATVTIDPRAYDFVRWIVNGANQPAGQTQVQVIVDGHITAIAHYQEVSGPPPVPVCALSVYSTPYDDVAITGDRPGTTTYMATCNRHEVVSLTAPSVLIFGQLQLYLDRWVVNGIDQPDRQAQVQITMDGDTIATAVYEVWTQILTVLSAPLDGVVVKGNKPGTTGYSALCFHEKPVYLIAPPTATVDSVRYDFVRWIVDGVNQPAGETLVQFTVDADLTVTAVYAVSTHTLSVVSMPINDVAISGDKPGSAPYAATCDDQQIVTLNAPGTVPGTGGADHNFHYWLVDNEPQAYGEKQLQLKMGADHNAMAIYDERLDGDNNGDCVVNVLDLLYVRNRLNTRYGE